MGKAEIETKHFNNGDVESQAVTFGEIQVTYNLSDVGEKPYIYLSLEIGNKEINISLDENGKVSYFLSIFDGKRTREYSDEDLTLEMIHEALAVRRATILLNSTKG